MKKSVIVLFLISVILLTGFVSGNVFGDFFGKITGNQISNNNDNIIDGVDVDVKAGDSDGSCAPPVCGNHNPAPFNTQGVSVNTQGVIVSVDCYCDELCKTAGTQDCCQDYEQFCYTPQNVATCTN